MLKIGHRGASHIAPANTMASFKAAVALGCDWVECDCRPSADGVIVLAHDAAVTDRSGRAYVVEEYVAEELARLDLGAGEGVPTLAELVAWAVGHCDSPSAIPRSGETVAGERRCGVMADVKRDGFEPQIGAVLEPLVAEAKIVPGAGPAGRHRFRSLFPALPVSLTMDAAHEAALRERWETLDTDAVTLEWPLVTPERVADLHRRAIRVFVWTVDDPARMRSLAAMGVDGIISNRADLLADLLAAL